MKGGEKKRFIEVCKRVLNLILLFARYYSVYV